MRKSTMALLAWMLAAVSASAEVPLSGTIKAIAACPAYQSIGRQSNPGAITTEAGARYELIAANREEPTHYLVLMDGASPPRRWVAVECLERDAGVAVPPQGGQAPAYRGTQYVLAVNWQPAFCETSPGKPECRTQREDSFEATNFTLHGLWPQPRTNQYCNVAEDQRQDSENGDWLDLPQVRLSPGLRAELDEVMPGAVSGLDRHEWTRHGSCYGEGAEQYYADSLDLMLGLNTSTVATLFADNIGRRLSVREVRGGFDQAFGAGAGDRVAMRCASDGNRTIITELTIALTGEISGPDDFGALIAAANSVDGDCRAGLVDAVGVR